MTHTFGLPHDLHSQLGHLRQSMQTGRIPIGEILKKSVNFARIRILKGPSVFGHLDDFNSLFFHQDNYLHGFSVSQRPSVGDAVLFEVGLMPGKDGRMGKRAVSWCLVSHVEWGEIPPPESKNSFDLVRFELALQNCDDGKLNEFSHLLYDSLPTSAKIANRLLIKDWQPKKQLAGEWLARLAKDGLLDFETIRRVLLQFPMEVPAWLTLIPHAQLDRALEIASREQIIQIMGQGNSKIIERVCQLHSISVDLETDGNNIWEIGIADHSGKEILFSKRNGVGLLDSALTSLAVKLKAKKIIVGHNILKWDLPVLRKLNAELFADLPAVWDTLFTSCVLDPWKSSHALGSSHRADDDAAMSLALFDEQLSRVMAYKTPPTLNLDSNKPHALLTSLCEGLANKVIDAPPPGVINQQVAIGRLSRQAPLMVSNTMFSKLQWDPRFCPVEIDGQTLTEFDAKAFAERVQGHPEDPVFIAIHSILQGCIVSKIIARIEMLPDVLRLDEDVKQVLSQCRKPHVPNGTQVSVCKYPTDGELQSRQWDEFQFLNPPQFGALIQTQATATPPFVQPVRTPRAVTLYTPAQGKNDWWKFDPLGQRSTSGKPWHSLTIFWVAEARTVEIGERPRLNVKICKPVSPRVLHMPSSSDIPAYWIEVVQRFSSIATLGKGPQRRSIPILLIVNSVEPELLRSIESCLQKLSVFEFANRGSNVERSKAERLRRAIRSDHLCLVDFVATAVDWFALAAGLGLKLLPVIESLPMLDWYVQLMSKHPENPDVVADTDGQTDTEVHGIGEDGNENQKDDNPAFTISFEPPSTIKRNQAVAPLLPVNNAEILQTVLGTRGSDQLQELLSEWLVTTIGLPADSQPILLDPRLAGVRLNGATEVSLPDLPFSSATRTNLLAILDPLQPAIPRETPESSYAALQKFLASNWGFPDFRDAQKPAITAIADHSANVLVTLPTGGGKSVLFQVPALCRSLSTRRLSIVISPLKALMRDQVEGLQKTDKKPNFFDCVDYLSGDRPRYEKDEVFQGILDHRICLLYVAPERFRSRRFLEILDRRYQDDGGFEFLIIDEAHCVSQWGYEFRPDYFHALEVWQQKYQPPPSDKPLNTPWLMFSATVTTRIRDDLKEAAKASGLDELRIAPDGYTNPIREHIAIRTRNVVGSVAGAKPSDWTMEPRIAEIQEVMGKALQNRINNSTQKSAVIVFVARRAHAEELALELTRGAPNLRIDYFHAGLDAEIRQEVYVAYRNAQIDVLVATKAFGMGMDIEHIHWAVHLSPPSYLEDYLQEVGRIGRDADKMLAAKLERLDAVLLHSSDDFQSNQTAIQRGRIDAPQLQSFLQSATKACQAIEADFVAVIPDTGFGQPGIASARRSAETQTRVILYWLEQMGRVTLLQTLPGLLPIRVIPAQLKLHCTGVDLSARVSSHIAYLCEQAPRGKQTAPEADPACAGLLDRILTSVGNFFGFLLGERPSAATPATINPDPIAPSPKDGGVDAVVNIPSLVRATSSGVFEILDTLAKLQAKGALTLIRKLHVGRGLMHRQLIDAQVKNFFDAVESAAQQILSRIAGQGEREITDAMIAPVPVFNDASNKSIDVNLPFKKAVMYLLRLAGAKTRQKIVNDDVTPRLANVATFNANRFQNTPARIVNLAIDLLQVFKLGFMADAGSTDIELAKVLDTLRKQSTPCKQRQLEQALGLLATMRLAHCSEPLLPMCHIVQITEPDTPFAATDHPVEYEKLKEVNSLAELRGHTMELFVELPEEEREQFLHGYFAQSTSDELEKFLLSQLLKVTSESQAGWVSSKLQQIQRQGVKELFDPFRGQNAPSPNQWKAISHPFDQHLLVNAGPGAGKTKVLIARIAYLIHEKGIKPEHILVLAFNRAVVFEIRARIRELFYKLGYGAYVRRLRVSTFHALATRHIGSARDGANQLGQFALMLTEKPSFAAEVADGVQAILMDEYQDVDRNIFTIIKQLQHATNAKVMAIGDDDQDILRWNRLSSNVQQTQAAPYFDDFVKTFQLAPADQLTLEVNFRSGKEIVVRSQNLLNKFFGANDKNARLKVHTQLNALDSASDGKFCKFEAGEAVKVAKQLLNAAKQRGESVAILCRSNSEVVQLHQDLSDQHPHLAIQHSDNALKLKQLRNVACFLDLCEQMRVTDGDLPIAKVRAELLNRYQKLDIPEVSGLNPGSAHAVSPTDILQLLEKEKAYSCLSDLLDFADSTRTDEYQRMLGKNDGRKSTAIVSTIHKVKGLEFDHVLFYSSNAPFPLKHQVGNSIPDDAAEEARLLYVALTRAKQSVHLAWGNRESAWWKRDPYVGTGASGATILSGSLEKEIVISYSARVESYAQDYIEKRVCVGDPIFVSNGRCLCHGADRKPIGALCKGMSGGSNNKLRVAAVVRYPTDPTDTRYYPRLHAQVKHQGWSYVVLVSGSLKEVY